MITDLLSGDRRVSGDSAAYPGTGKFPDVLERVHLGNTGFVCTPYVIYRAP